MAPGVVRVPCLTYDGITARRCFHSLVGLLTTGNLTRAAVTLTSSGGVQVMSEMSYGHQDIGYLENSPFTTMSRAQQRSNRRRRNGGGKKPSNPGQQSVIPRAPSSLVLTRLHDLGTLAPVATDFGYALVANLNVLPNVSELTALFQEYRLTNAVWDLTFIPASTERYSPTVWYANYVVDTSGAGPASLSDVSQTSGVRRFAFGPDKRILRIGFKPRIRTSDTVYMLMTSPWITTFTPNVNHGGLWLWFQDFNATEALGARIRLTVTLTVQLRGTR